MVSWYDSLRKGTMRRRDFLVLAGGTAAASAALLSGCGESSGSTTNGGVITLNHWYSAAGEAGTKEAVFRYASDYSKAHPNVQVKVTWIPGDYTTKLNAALLSPNPPDIFELGPGVSIDGVKAKLYAPLDDLFTPEVKAAFHPQDMAVNTVDGHIYGVKDLEDFTVLYYRKSLLQQAGVKPPTFTRSLTTFFVFALLITPLTVLCSLGLALLVNNIPFARGFFRSVFFIPSACSVVVAAMIWRDSLFLGTAQGFFNVLLGYFHIDPIIWISDNYTFPWYWVVLVSCRLWLGLGFNMVLFLAGLQQISPSLYEAAFVDGAKQGWQTFRNITFPLLRNTTAILISLNLISAFQAFDEFYNILGGTYGGANMNLAKTPLIYLFQVAFQDQDYGKGSAGAFILAGIIVLVTIVQTRFYGFGNAENQ